MCPSDSMQHLQGIMSWDQTTVRELRNPASVEQAFKVLDRDGDGEIRSADLWEFFRTCMGVSMSQEEADAMITAADLDGDGAVNLKEFQCLVGYGALAVPQKVDLHGNKAANLENYRHQASSDTPLAAETTLVNGDTDGGGHQACETAEFDSGKWARNLACLGAMSIGHQSESGSRVRGGAQAGLQSLSPDPDIEALLWEAFCVLDVDKDGLLSPHDLKCATSACCACGWPSLSDTDVHAMLAANDGAMNGLPAGTVDFKSFLRLLSSHVENCPN